MLVLERLTEYLIAQVVACYSCDLVLCRLSCVLPRFIHLVLKLTLYVPVVVVASIEEFAERYSVPKPFIGLILLPLVVSTLSPGLLPVPAQNLSRLFAQANAAEHVTSVWMAMKNQMELTITISVGSSIQIATFVVPLLVIVGWISGHELTLFFANFEVRWFPR